jgi:hypothetical protein
MKELSGRAAESAATGKQRTVEFLADVAAYPQWYPDVVRAVDVLERGADGQAERVRATLHAAVGPISRDLDLVLAVSRAADEVKLSRVPNAPSDRERFDVTWHVSPADGGGSRIALALDAALDVPRLVPLGGVGDSLAGGFVAAAVRALDDGAA